MSAARDLFEQFKAGGETLLERVCTEGWTESLILDFKQAARSSGPMEKDDRKSLGKELSAFANSDGGLIVWGVRADAQTPDESDAATELKPIRNLNRFLSDLQRNTPQMASPPVDGVVHESISKSGEADDGYILTYVPRSEGLPVMAKGPDQHRFYVRCGSSSLPMETYMLADRFGRRPHPKLELGCRVSSSTWNGEYRLDIVLAIRNAGAGIALYPALALHEGAWKLAEYGLDGNGRYNISPRLRTRGERRGTTVYVGGANDAIHPGTHLDVARIEFTISSDGLLMGHGLAVKYDLHSDGFSLVGAERKITGREFQRAMESRDQGWL